MNSSHLKSSLTLATSILKMTKKKTTERTKEIIRLLQEGEE
jgi:hypothetical protein